MNKYLSIFTLLLLFNSLHSIAQKKSKNLVYVDSKGVMRFTSNKNEAAFFGVNYTVPFAYGYRSHKALGVDIEKAIDADVHHMARLGLDAFRVHVWDVEISDSLGNLSQNEHLRLFDYLVQKLKKYNIKLLLTPIAFWGNGYPEPDTRTNGFSYVYTKGGSVVKEEAFKAQENYLKQFFTHVNPYTGLTYRDDPDVIAMEINNEPQHSGPKERTTEYVNRMASAVKSTGWTKPIFYNISESPSYADAVAKARVDGHSFQWYPTGLVANHEQRGNFLPNVSRYHVPFGDTIAAFRNRAKMVYEFDAGDVMQPVMYPAMARSYRTAGFQWATQFAYDPLHTAYGNTEYQTHYLNLVYTPAKAISLLIAAKAFHRLSRGKSYGAYPADTLFDVFRVSYKEQLSEMNSEEEFYYTSNTSTLPKNSARLKHTAGVGSSPLVQYEGTGAYFLDKVADGVWRLEIMPDAIAVKDPFEKASPKKEVTRIQWRANRMKLLLPEFSDNFTISAATTGNPYKALWNREGNFLHPGVYFLTNPKGGSTNYATSSVEYYAPPSSHSEPYVVHYALAEVTPGKPYPVTAMIAGTDTIATVSVEIRHSSNQWKILPMQRLAGYNFRADVPAEIMTPGLVNYRIMVKTVKGDIYTFPGGLKGDPYAWDEHRNESWQTYVAGSDNPLEVFNPTRDRSKIMLYNPDRRNNMVEYTASMKPNQLVMKATMNQPKEGQFMGWQYYFRDKIGGRRGELSSFTKVVLRARASVERNIKLSLITANADAYAATVALTKEWRDIEIPFHQLEQTDFLLLPRPYPGFQPLLFKAEGKRSFSLTDAEKIEFRFGGGSGTEILPFQIEIESVWLTK